MQRRKRIYGLVKSAGNKLESFGARSEGGAKLRVKAHSDKAEAKGIENNIPFVLAKLYSPSPVVNLDQTRDEGGGMVPRMYIPVAGAEEIIPRTTGQKFANWIQRGKFS
jgi:hypothetical protein